MPWGYRTATHGTPTAGTTSGTILAANAGRRYALFINDSDTVVYLGLGTAAAVANKGIRLAGSGGFYEMTTAYGNLFTGVVMGIHGGSGSKTILVTEGQ